MVAAENDLAGAPVGEATSAIGAEVHAKIRLGDAYPTNPLNLSEAHIANCLYFTSPAQCGEMNRP
jgi:hypothetical protein